MKGWFVLQHIVKHGVIEYLIKVRHHLTGIRILRMVGKHYSDVIMGAITSEITSLTIVYSSVYSGSNFS